MLIRTTGARVHPEFDLDATRQLFAKHPRNLELAGEQITSPFDLYAVETLRDEHRLRVGEAVPTDVFVMGRGEPPRPDLTQIGGHPYWPIDRPWPVQADGRPWLFLAQFSFADSRDLIADPPGDVLLLLAENEIGCMAHPERIRFEWLSRGLKTISEWDTDQNVVTGGPFFGVIFRGFDYPDACDQLEELERVRLGYELPVLEATKIGGRPHLIQSGPEDWKDEFICQLSSVHATLNIPYPWANHPEPIDWRSYRSPEYRDDRRAMFGDVGSFYIFRRRNGAFYTAFECY